MSSITSGLSTTLDISGHLLRSSSAMVGENGVQAILGFSEFPNEMVIVDGQTSIPPLNLWVRTSRGYQRGGVLIPGPPTNLTVEFERELAKDNLTDVTIWMSAVAISTINRRVGRKVEHALRTLQLSGIELLSQDRSRLSGREYLTTLQQFTSLEESYAENLGIVLRSVVRNIKHYIFRRRTLDQQPTND